MRLILAGAVDAWCSPELDGAPRMLGSPSHIHRATSYISPNRVSISSLLIMQRERIGGFWREFLMMNNMWAVVHRWIESCADECLHTRMSVHVCVCVGRCG